jgi:head-tail adaptor
MPQRLIPATAWPHIDPGKKRHRVSIHAQGTKQDGTGGVTPTLGLAALNCYAAIETLTGRELFQDGFVSQVVHRISIDWPRSLRVTVDMRVVVYQHAGASVYEIQAIENVQERNLVMVLTCLEIDNAVLGS